jgi:hypothetical protein
MADADRLASFKSFGQGASKHDLLEQLDLAQRQKEVYIYKPLFVMIQGSFPEAIVIDRNGLRHMSDCPYKRHEPIVS